MNASDRLKKYDFYSQLLISYYSLLLIIVTIIDMKIVSFDASMPTLILSITLLVISVYIYAMDFGKRALNLKSTYIELQRILSKISQYKDTKSLEEDYYNILDCSENHNTCDYLQVLFEVRNQKKYLKVNGKFTYDKCLKYGLCAIKQKLLTFSLFILPILMILYYKDLTSWVDKLYASI